MTPSPPVSDGTDAVARWAQAAGVECARRGADGAGAKRARAALDALGRCRTVARDCEALLQARAQRGEAVEDAGGPGQPRGEVALTLWQWYELARCAWLLLTHGVESDGAATGVQRGINLSANPIVEHATAQVKHLTSCIRNRPTAEAEEVRRRLRLPRDAREAVREHEEVSAKLAEESLDDQAVRDAQDTLVGFAKWMKRGYLAPAHVQIVAAALERVERGECQRLVIELPPRAGKTVLTSELFATWYMGRHPDRDVISASHSQEFADGIGRSVRNGVDSEEFRRVFPDVHIAGDSSAAARFHVVNEVAGSRGRRGVYKSFGRTSRFTGSGANLLLIDDLTAEFEADSEAAKAEAHRAIRSLRSRLAPVNEGAAWVVINTRYRADDTIGHILSEYADDGPWERLRFPALAEEHEEHALPDGSVWTREPGDALWPERYSVAELHALRATLLRTSPQDWWGQYMARPVPASGALVDVGWFRRYGSGVGADGRGVGGGSRLRAAADVLAIAARVVLTVDTSKGGAAAARTAIQAWAEVTDRGPDVDGAYLLDAYAEPVKYVEQVAQVKRMADRWKARVVLIEDQSTGQAMIPDLQAARDWSRAPITAVHPVKDKVTRLSVCTPQLRDGQCWLPEHGSAPWLAEYEAEVTFFPQGRFADQVDATSQFLNWRHANPIHGAGFQAPSPELQRALGGSWSAGATRPRPGQRGGW